MDNRKYFLVGLGILAAATLTLFLNGKDTGTQRIPDTVNSSAEVKRTADGTRYTVHPSELIQGCPGKDCIPSIDSPRYEEDPGWMNPGDRIIGLDIKGDARAYPLKIMSRHEIVNDRVGGEPVAATYCPLCRSGFTYSREVNGETLEFGVSGKLLNANLVMYDRQTETYWSQIQGEAIIGPLVPQELELVHSSITNWSSWKQEHPDTKVLSRNTGIYPASTYRSSPYENFRRSESVGFGVGETDDRLPSKKLVYGVKLGGVAKAYPEEDVRHRNLVQDEVGEVPVLLLEAPDGSIKVFHRALSNRTLRFERNGSNLVDGAGNTWSFEGEALEGPYQGEALARLNSHGIYWFAWSEFHPGTKLYQPAA